MMLLRPQHSIGPSEVHVWHLLVERLPDAAAPQLARELLSADERQRMQVFAHERDRRLYLWSRCLMRTVLGSYLDRRGADLSFTMTAFGKPILKDAPLHFNLSHSRGAVALAISGERPVGVDVEERARQVEFLGLAERYFTAAEARHLEALDEARRADAFFAIWTLKEAYVKGIGRGLTFPLDAFSFDLDVARLLRFRPLADFVAADWCFEQFELGPRHCGAVAVQGTGAAVQLLDWAAAFLPG